MSVRKAYKRMDKAVNKFLIYDRSDTYEAYRKLIGFQDSVFSKYIIRVITYEEFVGKC